MSALGAPLHRRVPLFVWALLVGVALTLLTIGARSPYTHANLGAGYDARYDRTEQILVGTQGDFGSRPRAVVAGADAPARGATRYVTEGCARCHALAAVGGPVGPRIAGTDAGVVAKRVRLGSLGMPAYSAEGLSDDAIADIAAYLEAFTAP